MSTSLAKPKVIAEVANTHQGDIEVLYKMIKSLSKTSTDFIKFQIYSANELLVKSHKRYEHFKGQSFSKKEWGEILDYSKKNKSNPNKIKYYQRCNHIWVAISTSWNFYDDNGAFKSVHT